MYDIEEEGIKHWMRQSMHRNDNNEYSHIPVIKNLNNTQRAPRSPASLTSRTTRQHLGTHTASGCVIERPSNMAKMCCRPRTAWSITTVRSKQSSTKCFVMVLRIPSISPELKAQNSTSGTEANFTSAGVSRIISFGPRADAAIVGSLRMIAAAIDTDDSEES